MLADVIRRAGKRGWRLDLSVSDFGLIAVSAGTVLLQTSAVTAEAATGGVFRENRGDGHGAAVWTFPLANQLSPNVFSQAPGSGWSQNGAIVITTEGTRPDGGAAQRLRRSVGSAGVNTYYFIPGGPGSSPRTASVFIKDHPGDQPSSPGAILSNTFNGKQIPACTDWTRVDLHSYLDSAPINTLMGTLGIAPAGLDEPEGTFITPANGSVQVGGYSCVDGDAALPFILSASASAAKQLDPSVAEIVDADGDLDVEVTFLPAISSWYPLANCFIWSASTPDGRASVRWDNAQHGFIFEVRGVDVMVIPANEGMMYATKNTAMRVRVWYRPSDGKAGIRINVNGAFREITASATGLALAKPTAIYLGANTAGATSFPTRWAVIEQSTTYDVFPEILVIGDSLTDSAILDTNSYTSAASRIYSISEAKSRPGIGLIAQNGESIADQRARWVAMNPKWKQSVKAVFILLGINDMRNLGRTSAQITSDLISFIALIASEAPQAVVYLYQLLPCKTVLDAQQYIYWGEVNANIAGTGGTPITGVVPCTELTVIGGPQSLNNGLDDLATEFSSPDSIHENEFARETRVGPAYRARAVAQGVIP